MPDLLHSLLVCSANRTPNAIAIEEVDGTTLTYRELDDLSDRVRDLLLGLGVGKGDRVAFCLPKSVDAIALVFGILKAGAAYVPIDPLAPVERSAYIARDSEATILFVDPERERTLSGAFDTGGARPRTIVLPRIGSGKGVEAIVASHSPVDSKAATLESVVEDDVAYIIYTSGSTGRPKGAVLSHGNGLAYLSWAFDYFKPNSDDRTSLQFPLHFDPSVSDIFLSLMAGARLVLLEDRIARDPISLVRRIADRRLTVWISVPSILTAVAQHGKAEEVDLSSLRVVAFGGEVFPPVHLRKLRRLLPDVPLINLYGPTETNVCTYFEIPREIPVERKEPYPIGHLCGYLQGRVIETDGSDAKSGAEGELCVSGPNVMREYWKRPDRTREAFFEADGLRWYRTGDIVREEDGLLVFVGRRDRMVKRRSYRIELGEIEAALHNFPEFVDVAVVSTSREGVTHIHAVYTTQDGQPLSVIAMKGYCMKALPGYMVPDRFVHLETLPRTSTGKTDYVRISEMVAESVSPVRGPAEP